MSDCSCSIDYEHDCDPDDYAKYYKARIVKSYTVKKCCECGEPIKVGDKYRLAIARWKKFERFHTCLDCVSILQHVFCVQPYDGGLWAELGNYLEDNADVDFPWGCLPHLTPVARKNVCEAIEAVWAEYDYDD